MIATAIDGVLASSYVPFLGTSKGTQRRSRSQTLLIVSANKEDGGTAIGSTAEQFSPHRPA
jgi:hypothetical protein